MGGKGGSDYRVWYRMGLHMIWCHSSDYTRLKELRAGGKTFWTGDASTNTQLDIDESNLFGGQKREGGIKGLIDIMFGRSGQVANDYLTSAQGPTQPAYLGRLGTVFRQGYVSANNPYVKPWAAVVEDIYQDWHPELASITTPSGVTGQCNPAHILYRCLTDRTWGHGYPAAALDDTSWLAAATQLYFEQFGLSLKWSSESTLDDFTRIVEEHIDGTIGVDPTTGLITLRLIREDYTPASLPEFGPSNILELEAFESSAWEDLTSEVTVVYTDPTSYKEAILTVSNPATVQVQDAPVHRTNQYPALRCPTLASRVAMRDLSTLASPLAAGRFRVNRQAWTLAKGDPFKYTWPEDGVSELICRVADIDYGTLEDGAISITWVENAFGLPDDSYLVPDPGLWVNPIPDPAAPEHAGLTEAPYFELVRAYRENNPFASTVSVDPDACYVGAVGSTDDPYWYAIGLWTRTGAYSYIERDTASRAVSVVLAEAMGVEHQTVLAQDFGVDTTDWDDFFLANTVYGICESEIFRIDDLATGFPTLHRGCLDTVPQPHPIGAEILIVPSAQYHALDPTAWAETQSVDAYLTSDSANGTGLGTDPVTLVMAARQDRPYPPGNVQLNGLRYPAEIGDTDLLTVTWSHRDRTLQSDGPIQTQTAGNIGPEAGTTYTLRLYDQTDSLVRTETGLAGTTYTWTTEEADSGLSGGILNRSLRIELESVRDGRTSHQTHDITTTRAFVGWGYRWGENWGGE